MNTSLKSSIQRDQAVFLSDFLKQIANASCSTIDVGNYNNYNQKNETIKKLK